MLQHTLTYSVCSTLWQQRLSDPFSVSPWHCLHAQSQIQKEMLFLGPCERMWPALHRALILIPSKPWRWTRILTVSRTLSPNISVGHNSCWGWMGTYRRGHVPNIWWKNLPEVWRLLQKHIDDHGAQQPRLIKLFGWSFEMPRPSMHPAVTGQW